MPDEQPRHRLLGVMPREVETQFRREPEDTVPTWPYFLIRHVVAGSAAVAVVLGLSIAFNSPLQEMANRNLTPPVAKAPWYFGGLQELLAWFHPSVAGVLIPTAATLFLFLVPYLDRTPGWRARDRKLVTFLFTVLITAAIALTIVAALFRGPGWSWVWPWQELYLEL